MRHNKSIIVPEDTKFSKNFPCPCGSGRKHRKCCLNTFKDIGISHGKVVASTALKWFTQVVDNLDLGKDCGKGPRHVNSQYPKWSVGYDPTRKNGAIIDCLNELVEAKNQGRRCFAYLNHKWTKKLLKAHCAGDETWYFSGPSHWKQRFVLIMIDVDCKTKGTPEGARAYLEFLRDNYFPNLYIEVSTHGRGGHGYLLVDRYNLDNQQLNDILLHRLCPWLNMVCGGFDVEFVEVKGTVPVVEWGDNGQVLRYTAGCQAKVPRGLFDHFDEIKNMPVVFGPDLKRLERVESVRDEKTGLKIVLAESGSTTGKNFVELLPQCEVGGVYYNVASELLKQKGGRLKTSDRNIVTAHDLAVWLMIAKYCTETLDENGGLPTSRIMGLWKKLKDDREISRSWNSRRHKAIRDFLSDLGLLSWEDETYRPGFVKDGEWCKGVCMKWALSPELMSKLDVFSPKQKEERHALLIHDFPEITNWVSDLVFCDPEDEIRPIEIIHMDVLRYTPEQATAMVGCFDIQVA